MGKFRRTAEAAILLVEDGQRRLHHDADQARRKLGLPPGKALGVGQHVHGFVGRLQHLVAALAIGVGNCQQDLLETGTSPLIVGRKVGSTVKRMAIGSEKDGQRPAAGAGDGRDCKLIAAVDVRPLVAIDLHRDEFAIDDLGDVGALVGFAVHDVTPVAPHRADVEQDGLVLALRLGEGFLAPLMPLDGLMHGRAQVSGRGLRQRVGRFRHEP